MGAGEADRGKQGRWGQARLVGAGEANGGRKPPGQIPSQQVQVQKKWGLVRSRSKNYSDWIGLDLDGPGLDWSNAGLVESLGISRSFIPEQSFFFCVRHSSQLSTVVEGI